MQLCRIIYYPVAALYVSSDIFAHHHEHLNCITASGITHVQGVPLATEPGISLIILTRMKILQRNLNRSTFVV
jgi:hypothetical protein